MAKEEEEKLKREEDERLAKAEEALKRAAVERERAREAGEQQRMAQHDEDIGEHPLQTSVSVDVFLLSLLLLTTFVASLAFVAVVGVGEDHLFPPRLLAYATDIVLRANVAIAQEEAKLEREAEAVREAEELERVAQDAKRKHACLLMSKADEESVLWNERWQMEDVVVKVGYTKGSTSCKKNEIV